MGLGAASVAAQYVVTHPQPSHNPINLDFLLDPLSKSKFLSLNLIAMIKKLALTESWQPKWMKAVRFSLINLPGRVVNRSRRLIIRLTKKHPSLELLVEARKKIAMLKPVPCG